MSTKRGLYCEDCTHLRIACQCDEGDGMCPGCPLCEPEGRAHPKDELSQVRLIAGMALVMSRSPMRIEPFGRHRYDVRDDVFIVPVRAQMGQALFAMQGDLVRQAAFEPAADEFLDVARKLLKRP